MISTFAGLNTMVAGVQTNRVALNTVGHNISNSSTEGYSRQKISASATRSQTIWGVYGPSQIGTGVSVTSIARARDIYADRQYWKEKTNDGYYNAKASNYSKLETIFNDSDDNGLQAAMTEFYQAWTDCSTTASTSSSRQNVINKGYNFAETLNAAAVQVQEQIDGLYQEIILSVENINSLTDQIVTLNRQILTIEADGSMANDLRDERDLLVDKMSKIMHVSVSETEGGMYTLVSNGSTLVNGTTKVTLEVSEPINNAVYGISDYTISIREAHTPYNPGNGELFAQIEAVQEDKEYLDRLANMAAFLMTTLNDQHKAGYTLATDSSGQIIAGDNFFGDTGTTYTWDATRLCMSDGTNEYRGVQIIKMLSVNEDLTRMDGHKLLATRSMGTDGVINGVADGSNAVWISTLFNCVKENTSSAVNTQTRSIGDDSFYSYYNTCMTTLGSSTENMKNKVDFQADLMTQIENLRESTSGVNWDEELSNMIMFQQGYAACSRCLTTMDEMLDKLINGTGTVGR